MWTEEWIIGRCIDIKMLKYIHIAPSRKYYNSQHINGWVICGVRPILYTNFCSPLPTPVCNYNMHGSPQQAKFAVTRNRKHVLIAHRARCRSWEGHRKVKPGEKIRMYKLFLVLCSIISHFQSIVYDMLLSTTSNPPWSILYHIWE